MIQDLSYKISSKLKSIIRNFSWFDIIWSKLTNNWINKIIATTIMKDFASEYLKPATLPAHTDPYLYLTPEVQE